MLRRWAVATVCCLSVFMIFGAFSCLYALSSPILVGSKDHNILEKDTDTWNELISAYNVANDPDLPTINSVGQKFETSDIKSFEFSDLSGTEYLAVKYGKHTDLLYVNGLAAYNWTTPKNGLSHYIIWRNGSPPPQVPEPSTMTWLVIFGIGGLGLAVRKKFKF